jgi:hypothetical protein
MANIPKEELIAITVASLRSHWRNVRGRLLRGHWDPVGEKGLFDCFEADTTAHKKILARRFYSLKHAEKILSLSDSKLKSNISYYTEIAAEHALDEFEGMPDEQRDYMRSLPKYEYVLIEGDRVSAFPARVLYDDWYERSVGAMTNFDGYIMKSTGENFSKLEAEWLDASVRTNTRTSCEFWRTGIDQETPNRIAIWITELERVHYLSEVEDGLWRGTKSQLIALLRHLRDECSEHSRETRLIERLLANASTTKKADLLADFWKMLQSEKTAEVYAVTTDTIVDSNWNIPQ